MKVVEEWKNRLGKDWESTYAVSNTLYVARQNNILFTRPGPVHGNARRWGIGCCLIETPGV